MGWQVYYRAFLEDSAGRALIDHRGPHVGDELRQEELINSMAGGRKVFIVSAPAGCGKSRFALELARRIGRVQRSWDVRFVRPDAAAPAQELAELKTRHLVLIVDDAHDCPEVVQQLAPLVAAAEPQSPVHLVCLTRPAGRAALAEVLAGEFASGEPVVMDLGRPDTRRVRELIDKLIPQLSPHHRDVIRRSVSDSYFAPVLLCSSVARQKSLPQTLSPRNLREYAVRQPIAQAVQHLCPIETALRALAVYSACAPARSGDAALRAAAATHSGLSVAEVQALERLVLEAGLFQLQGERLRPVPDLLGELILEETCLNEQGRPTAFAQSLMRTLFDPYPDQVSRNCVDVGRLFATTPRVDLLSELVLERAEGLSAETPAEARGLLQACSYLAGRRPVTIVRLVEVLETRGVLRAAPAARELGHGDAPEVRARSLLVIASEHDPTLVPRAMEYSRHLLACARSDADSYRFLWDNLLNSCQFAVARPLAHAAAVLEVLHGWLAGSTAEAAELAAGLVHGFLQLEWAAVSVSLTPTGEIWKLRDRAIDILARAARNPSPAVQYAATDSLGSWARGYGNLTDDLRERWAPQLNRELDVLAESFAKLVSTTSHLPVRAAVEQHGWRWSTDALTQGAATRILGALPEAGPYSLWKALHDATLPIFAAPSLIRSPAVPVADLARELFERLEPQQRDAPAWSALFTSVLSELPARPLQQQAHLYVAEFVRRHPAAAWSLVTEASAEGPLGKILPMLLMELRGQDSPRWQETIQHSQPGTRLFEVQLRALCGAGELDPVERAMVSRGLDLDDASAVHLSAEALLQVAPTALPPGLAAVFAVLPTRPTDERLWELTLEAFARWGSLVLGAPAGEEAGPEMRATSGELLRLIRTYGWSLSWEQGPHTQRLAAAIAICAVAIPHTLKSWMREVWSTSADYTRENEWPLSMARWPEVVRLIGQSPTASFWQKQFVEWITAEPDLAVAGARGLAHLCGLTHPCVAPLVARIAQQPTNAALDALDEFVRSQRDSPQFVAEAVVLLRNFVDAPDVYDLLEKEIIFAMSGGSSAGGPGATHDSREAMLQAVDKLLVKHGDLPPVLRETLARAKQTLQSAVEEDLLRDRGPT